MFWDRLSIQPTWIVFFFQMSVGSDSDLNENEKDPYQQSVQENEIDILIFQLTHHILISIPIPSTNLFFQLTHQFNLISVPTSTKVLLMYLMTTSLVLHLAICLYANQLMY